jgi:DNA-binding response OmpR family regulator
MSGEVRKALIVDDEPHVRTQLARALEAKGLACEVAIDGAEALRRFHTGHHQLVVTDLRMPNMNGHLLATELLSSLPRPRVVVFTGVMEPVIVRDLLMRGVDDYITKPCDVKVFAAKMAALMEGPERRQAESSSSMAGPDPSLAAPQLEAEFEPLSLCVSSSARELLKSAWESLPNPPEELGNYISRLRSRTADSQHHLGDAIDLSSPVTCLPVDRQSIPVGSAFKLMGIELSSRSMRLLHTRRKKDYLALRWPSIFEEKRWHHAVARVQSCRPMTHLYEIVVDFVVLDQ